jgi:5-methyltetrahydropteroyltriglutamate--homocysteine methyltransferase
MRKSSDRILTSHAGSLPRTNDLIDANRQREAGKVDEAKFQERLRHGVADVVRRQKEAGIAVPGDGEYGKSMGHKINYRAWWSYSFQRLGGLEVAGLGLYDFPVRRSSPGHVVLSSFGDRRDRLRFAAAYADPESGVSTGPRATDWPVCVGPITYTGQAAIAADIANFKAALEANGFSEGFMTSIGPGSASRIGNEHYKSDEEFVFACAEAMREEYKAIVDAGFLLQIDDPFLVTYYITKPDMSIAECRKWAELRVEALNHAIEGIPAEKIRFHTCYSINMGPRIHDMQLKDIIDVILKVKAQGFTFEAANPRHEHEYEEWKRAKGPDDKVLLPGVITQSTVLVEHPELVAQRLGRFAQVVGRERVIASADCGFASFAGSNEVHPSIVWAKFSSLVEGSRIASKRN